MAWSDLTFTSSHVLTASDMNRLHGNFAALAAGAAGAPPIAVNSLMASGVASLATVEAVKIHIGGAASGTPAANTIYQDSIPKLWINFDGFAVTGGGGLTGVRNHFNVSGVLDLGTGAYRVYADRDFANASYAVCGSAVDEGLQMLLLTASNLLSGSFDIDTKNLYAVSADGDVILAIAIGDQ